MEDGAADAIVHIARELTASMHVPCMLLACMRMKLVIAPLHLSWTLAVGTRRVVAARRRRAHHKRRSCASRASTMSGTEAVIRLAMRAKRIGHRQPF